MCKSLTIPEVIEIVSKMWASTADIMALGCVGESNALDVKSSPKISCRYGICNGTLWDY